MGTLTRWGRARAARAVTLVTESFYVHVIAKKKVASESPMDSSVTSVTSSFFSPFEPNPCPNRTVLVLIAESP